MTHSHHSQSHGGQALPSRRAVVLGASNVARNLTAISAAAKAAWGTPLELMIASGHGRSYGQSNFMLGYTMPGILHCGLWQALDERPPMPTAALMTDIGNDILYGMQVNDILRWVETCLERLTQHAERIIVTQLPLATCGRLQPWNFLALRSLFFPRSRVSLNETLKRAHRLDAGVAELARRYNAQSVQPCEAWFGFDPIHIRQRHAVEAWQAFCAPWSAAPCEVLAPASWREWLRVKSRRAAEQRWLFWRQRQTQPVLYWKDGSSLSLY